MEATRRRSLRRTPKSRPRAGLPTVMRFTSRAGWTRHSPSTRFQCTAVTRILNSSPRLCSPVSRRNHLSRCRQMESDSLTLAPRSFPISGCLKQPAGVSNQTTEPKELTRGTSLVERPSISPDGTSVVFNIGHEGRANLHVMPITGGAPKQLTFLDSFNLGGVWSPDGTRIAFASTQGGRPRVWTVDAAGGIPRRLVSSDLSGESFDLTWSPATPILFQQPGNKNYYELDPDTGRERLLLASPVGWIFSPLHSPDGQKIAVAWARRPNRACGSSMSRTVAKRRCTRARRQWCQSDGPLTGVRSMSSRGRTQPTAAWRRPWERP